MLPQTLSFNTLTPETLAPTEQSLQQIVRRVLSTGRITTAERIWFHRIILSDLTLAPETLTQVRLLFDRLQMGLIKVLD